MEGTLILLLIAFGILIPIGSVLGFLAFLQRHRYQTRIETLERQLASLRRSLSTQSDAFGADDSATKEPNAPDQPPGQSAAPSPTPANSERWQSDAASAATTDKDNAPPLKESGIQSWGLWQRLRENWMVWLGGVSVGLAGIFMVSHSIALGLIGPAQQFLMALAVGAALHGGAEYLRRKHRGTDQVFAALAGGGSITLYAALLAGVHHFELISAGVALIGLAMVSLATLWLALIHGPVLAMMGLSGAYLVPILLGGDGGSVPILLGYSFLVTVSSLLLLRYVFRDWLWYSTLAGALTWWLITTTAEPSESTTAWYLAALFLAFGFLPGRREAANIKLREAFLPLLVFWGLSIAIQPAQNPFFWSWLLILPATAIVPHSRGALWYLPWAGVVVSAAGWLGFRLETGQDQLSLLPFVDGFEIGLASYLVAATGLTVGVALWQWRQHGAYRRWVSLGLLGPLVWLALAWLLLQGSAPSAAWATCTLLLGGLYGLMAWVIEHKGLGRPTAAFAILAAHVSYSLAAVMWFREASLTLALSIQIISLAWLARRYAMPELYWLLKLALALVVARLTFNPWIADYDTVSHWSLWTYGGALVCAAIASRLTAPEQPMRAWLEAATLHLLVLFLGTEMRYWLYDGDIFAHEFSMTEATLNCLLWGALSVTYRYRALASESLAWLYRWSARLLLLLAGLCYASLVTWHNPWWASHSLSSAPVFNLLLLAYGATSALALLLSRYPDLLPTRWSLCLFSGGFLLFSALEIRHLWQGVDMALSYGITEGELYTYSGVGLLYAIIAILYATRQQQAVLYKAGMALLGVVIAKIFLIDMAGLQGLWRVAAFMGLGLALLGLAWLYRNMDRPNTVGEAGADTQSNESP